MARETDPARRDALTALNRARGLTEPVYAAAGLLTPAAFAEVAREVAQDYGFDATIEVKGEVVSILVR